MSVPCPDCFTGTLRGDVVPRGREEIIHGLPTYVAWPEPGVRPLGIVVILSDAFGWKLLNTRALADVYAQRVPCIVYVPDFMNGHAPPQEFLLLTERKPSPTANPLTRLLSRIYIDLRTIPHLLSFIYHNRSSLVQPRITSFLHAVRQTTVSPAQSAPGKLAVAGFCWGGPYAVRLTHDKPENKILFNPSGVPGSRAMGAGRYHVVDCVFTAHPSLLKVPGDVEAVRWPLSVANGDDDEWMGRGKMEVLRTVLEGKNRAWREGERADGGSSEDGDQDGPYEVRIYPGAKHGFAVRGDREDPMQRERGWRSEDQAVRWFRRWFREEGGR